MATRILVMDDDHDLLELYRMLLEEEGGYLTITSLAAIEEVTTIAEMQPDLIVLDAHLGTPGKGLHLLEQLKQYRPTQAIPVLLCSAAPDAIRPYEEAIRDRGDAILYKPFEIDELLGRVQQLLRVAGTAAQKS